MTKNKAAQRQSAPGRDPADGPWARVLFFASLVIVGLRPLIQETHDTARQPLAAALQDLPDIGPLPTLWINLAIVAVFGFTLALRFAGRLPKPRRSGLAIGFVVVAAAVVASCFIASNKRLAINTALDWITLPMLAIALAHLLQHAWQMRLALCVIVASGVASAVESLDQAYVTLPQTVEMYEQNKDEFWREQGVAPDSYQIILFENRVYEQAANGFFAMANIAGSYLVLAIYAALSLGLVILSNHRRSHQHPIPGFAQAKACGSLTDRIAAWLRAGAIGGLAMIMTAALVCTKSRGAVAALLLGLLTLVLMYFLRRFIRANPRRAFLLGWAVVVGGLVCVAGYGLAKGGLPGGSLTYRWWYLETTAKMVADHPLLGVGSGQYGRYYPRYKDIKSPEEITNPHNFLAHAAAEWGLGGLGGMMLMLVGGSRVVAGLRNGKWKMENGENRSATVELDRNSGNLAHPYLWGALLLVSIWVLKVWISGITDFNYIYGHLTLPILGWLVAFALCAAVVTTTHSQDIAQAEACGSLRSAAAVLGVGLFAFLVHNLISFSLFVPGSATTFFALLAVCIAMRHEEALGDGARPALSEPKRRPRAAANRPLLTTPAGFVTMLALTFMYFFAIKPVAQCWELLGRARAMLPAHPVHATTHYYLAGEDALDPTAPKEAAALIPRHWLNPDNEDVAMVGGMVLESSWTTLTRWAPNEAQARDPASSSTHRACAAAYLAGSRLDTQFLHLASGSYDKVLERYPTNPYDHLRMSEIQTMLYEANGEAGALGRAIDELEIALDLDGQRDPEEIRRFSAKKVAQIEEQLERLRQLRNGPPGE